MTTTDDRQNSEITNSQAFLRIVWNVLIYGPFGYRTLSSKSHKNSLNISSLKTIMSNNRYHYFKINFIIIIIANLNFIVKFHNWYTWLEYLNHAIIWIQKFNIHYMKSCMSNVKNLLFLVCKTGSILFADKIRPFGSYQRMKATDHWVSYKFENNFTNPFTETFPIH